MEFLIADKFVGGVCHEALQTGHECVYVSGAYVHDELLDLKGGSGFSDGSVVGDEKFHEAFLHLLVWKS